MAHQLKCAKPDTVVEIDHMILDFLAFEAATALFDENLARSFIKKSEEELIVNRFADNKLQMAKSFSDLFLYNHSYSILPATVAFRFNLMRSLELLTRHPAQCSFDKFADLIKYFADHLVPDGDFQTVIKWLGFPEKEQWKTVLRDESRKTALDALKIIHRALPLPTLTQLERGKVDGLTAEETAELKKKVDWPKLVKRSG